MRDSSSTLRLRPPRNPVERRAVTWWAAQAVAWWGALLLVLVITALLIPPARRWLLLAAGVVLVVLLVDAVLVSRLRYRVHRWEMTDDAVYARSGWFLHEWRVAPMSRVQTVDTKRGPLEQRFGLSTVYDPARTVVDMMRLRGRFGEPLAHGALRRYLARRDALPRDLITIARELDVLGPVRTALDIASAL